MIRLATFNDCEQILDLIEEFHRETLKDRGVAFDREYCKKDIFTYCGHDAAVSLVIEDGGAIQGIISAIVMRRPFFQDVTAQEIIWYVRQSVRREGVRLLKDFEKECAKRGCTSIAMIALTNSKAEGIYERFGYTKEESCYFKRIGG